MHLQPHNWVGCFGWIVKILTLIVLLCFICPALSLLQTVTKTARCSPELQDKEVIVKKPCKKIFSELLFDSGVYKYIDAALGSWEM